MVDLNNGERGTCRLLRPRSVPAVGCHTPYTTFLSAYQHVCQLSRLSFFFSMKARRRPKCHGVREGKLGGMPGFVSKIEGLHALRQIHMNGPGEVCRKLC